MSPELALGLFALALAVGVYGSIIGAGGGFVIVAGLVLLFDLPAVEAVGTSVITTAFIQLSAAINYDKAGMIDRATATWFVVGAIPVAFFAAAVVASRIPEQAFNLIIGVMLLALAIYVAFRPEDEGVVGTPEPPKKPQLIGAGSAIGILSGAFGVGAGLVTVPTIRWLQKLSTHKAAATTTAIGVGSGFSSGIGHTVAGNPNWSYAPFLVLGAIIGGRIGSNSADKLSHQLVGILLAAGLFATGLPLLIKALA